jgi:DNA ligase-1
LTAFVRLCEALDAVASTSSKKKKVEILAQLFKGLEGEEVEQVVGFITGHLMPWEVKGEPSVGFSTIWSALTDVYKVESGALARYLAETGDLGLAAEIAARSGRRQEPFVQQSLGITEVWLAFRRMAEAKGEGSAREREQRLRGLLLRASPLESKYIVKFLLGEVRIGAVEGIVAEALAEAFRVPRRALSALRVALGHMFEAARAVRLGRLEPPLEPGRPVGFMLALPLKSIDEAAERFTRPYHCEYKYDGVRAQAHKKGALAWLFSRRLEDISPGFPEVLEALRACPHDFILDGELVAFKDGRPLPFFMLQHRLRTKEPRPEPPVAYFAYDLLYLDGEPLTALAWRDRRRRLEALLQGQGSPLLRLAPLLIAEDERQLASLFEAALASGYEGLMIKDPSSAYQLGQRGGFWAKLKRELFTLDAVVVGAELGHGKRAGLLSDLIFAVWDEGRLRVLGKAYSGLTDEELGWITERLRALAVKDEGFRVWVRPELVVEVAFDAIRRSDRHESGFALRFPRIKALRLDKRPEEADSLKRVRELYELQRQRLGGAVDLYEREEADSSLR